MTNEVKLTKRQLDFAEEVARNGGDKVSAYRFAGYKCDSMSKAALSVEADKLYNHPKISLKIKILEMEANKVAKRKFCITVEERLKWLLDIKNAGLETYVDQNGNSRRENLNASNAAIKSMNEMLGVTESGDGVKPVKVVIGVKDASRP